MIKTLCSVALLCTTLYAHEPDSAHHIKQPHLDHNLHDYIVLKGVYTLGDTASHGEGISLEGNSAKGLGLDIGHQLSHFFAVELTSTYEENDITETDSSEPHVHEKEVSANYLTLGVDLIFTKHLNHDIGLFAKTGLEYEREEIDEHSENAFGLLFALGAEYKILPDYEVLVEYEKSTIESPKGDNLYVGLKTNLN